MSYGVVVQCQTSVENQILNRGTELRKETAQKSLENRSFTDLLERTIVGTVTRDENVCIRRECHDHRRCSFVRQGDCCSIDLNIDRCVGRTIDDDNLPLAQLIGLTVFQMVES